MSQDWIFPAQLSSVGRARRDVQQACEQLDLADVDCSDLALVVSELVSNAYLHTAGPSIRVRLSQQRGGLLLEVSDHSRFPPAVLTGADGNADAEGGRGMFLVDCLAVEHGHRLTDTGKVVWAQLGGRRSHDEPPQHVPGPPTVAGQGADG